MYHLLFVYLFIICTIQVKEDSAKSQWEDDSIIKTRAAVPIQELMNQPEMEAARKFVEEKCLMTFSMGIVNPSHCRM